MNSFCGSNDHERMLTLFSLAVLEYRGWSRVFACNETPNRSWYFNARHLTNHDQAYLDTCPAGVLHERPRSLIFSSSRTANPGEKGRAFCDRTNDSTRFAQPH